MGLFDVHAHLTHPRMAPALDEVLARARQAGVTTIVSNGLHPEDNAAVLALARRDPLVKPAIGLYPVDAVMREMLAAGVDYPRDGDGEPPALDDAIAFVRDHVDEAFAVGEVGLDGYWVPESLWAAQEEAFRRLVRIAIEADRPLIVHTRKRERRALEILHEEGARRVDFHCFGGKVSLARQVAESGYHLSIPANARRSESFTRMLQTLPRERILLETDCPYLAPVKDRGSEPSDVTHTLAYAAELWETSEAAALAQLEDNFEALFRCRP
ncbi:MAG: TatD family hydrolase [Deltaproteobacteria bacterium]|nr:TatD family hydrolase [Deltaproteobacteria bacterium]